MKRNKDSSAEEQKRSKAEMRQFLSRMDDDLVGRIKRLAFKKEVTASSLVRRAVAEWQRRERKKVGGAT